MDFRALAGARPSRQVDDLPMIWFSEQRGLDDLQNLPAAEAAKRLDFGFDPVDQGTIPCCVAVALTAAMRFVGATPPLAPLFNYFLSRVRPTIVDDVEIADAFRSAMNEGVCRASLHPSSFDLPSALISPSAAALTDALGQRLVPDALGRDSFGLLPVAEDQWKQAIEESSPVLMGFFMSPEYDDIRGGRTLVHDSPTTLGSGHACLVIGYDDALREFTIRDSRGPNVGAAGTWQLPYARLGDGFIYESWAVIAVP